MMIKLLTTALLSVFTVLPGFYDINVQMLDQTTVSMGNYKGKKVLVCAFDACSKDSTLLLQLDSIQRKHTTVKIVAVPARDFCPSETTPKKVAEFVEPLQLSIAVTTPVWVKKKARNGQYNLLKWLTSVQENAHFERDVEQPGYIFIVNEVGELFSVMRNGVSLEFIDRNLRVPPVRE